MEGEILGGRYEVLRELGRGGMGAVYEARHTGTGRRVAVKLITAELLKAPGLVERFEVEARAAGGIESQHIAQVLDAGPHVPGARLDQTVGVEQQRGPGRRVELDGLEVHTADADRRADHARAAGRRDTGQVTTATTRIERSGPAVRAALAQLSPEECAQFEAEFAGAPAPERPQAPAWQRAALLEGVSAKETIEDLRGGSAWLS